MEIQNAKIKNFVSSEPKRVLVVDDQQSVLDLVKDFLISMGFEVITALNGERALHLLKKEFPHILITDILIPHLDGFSLVKEVRKMENGKKLPIIMMSGLYKDLKMKKRVTKEYHADFLIKPFSLRELNKKVQKIFPKDKHSFPNSPTIIN